MRLMSGLMVAQAVPLPRKPCPPKCLRLPDAISRSQSTSVGSPGDGLTRRRVRHRRSLRPLTMRGRTVFTIGNHRNIGRYLQWCYQQITLTNAHVH